MSILLTGDHFDNDDQMDWFANNLIWISLGITDNGRFEPKYYDSDFYYNNMRQFIQLFINRQN